MAITQATKNPQPQTPLVSYENDQASGLLLKITKQLVDAAVVAGLNPVGNTPNTLVDGTSGVRYPGMIDGGATGPPIILVEHQSANSGRDWQIITSVVQLPGQALVGFEVDQNTGIIIRLSRQIVDAAVVAAINPAAQAPNTALTNGVRAPGIIVTVGTGPAIMVEHKTDKIGLTWQIISTVTSLPDPEIYPATVQLSLPAILEDAYVAEAWAESGDGTVEANSAALHLDITDGYSGPANAVGTKSWTFGPPASIPDITPFFPQHHAIDWYWFYFVTSNAGAEARTWDIPRSLHTALTISIEGSPSGTGVVGTLPATTPTGYLSGDLLVSDSKTEKLRIGLWFTDVIIAEVPPGL